MTSALDHLEKTLSESYRKEIDQEENIWRSLPFFAAAIALQITVLSTVLTQVVRSLPSAALGPWWDAIAAIVVASILITVALAFLAMSVAPARFRYITREPELLEFAHALDHDEQAATARGDHMVVDAAAAFKATLAEQYALAAHHNWTLNQRRALNRSLAGLATIGSVLATVFLVARLMLHYIPS